MMFTKRPIVFCVLLIVSECSSLTSTSYLSKKQVRAKEITTETELCGPIQEINLSGTGNHRNAVSQLVVLSASDKRICKLRVIAPKMFKIKMHFMTHFSLLNDYYKPCKMSIFRGNHQFVVPTWTIDPCTDITFEDYLLPSEFTIAWKPLSGSYFFNKYILLSVVGTGEVCKDISFFSCNNEKSWDSSEVCVHSSLLCDGTINCPYTNNDEDFCEPSSFDNSLKVHIPVEYDYKVTTSVTSYKKQLGWGGSLVVAILFGIRLCVCCARLQKGSKSEPEAQPIQTRETGTEADIVSQNQATGPTIVLIVHQPDEEPTLKEERDVEENNHNPPKYEDLEQPPPYSTLL